MMVVGLRLRMLLDFWLRFIALPWSLFLAISRFRGGDGEIRYEIQRDITAYTADQLDNI